MVDDPKTTPLSSRIPSDQLTTGEVPTYITKSNFYRVVHADGIYGGGTPTPGNIMMTFFSHRVPFPERTVNDFKGNEIVSKREAKWGVEQEYEVSVVFNLDMAKTMILWLTNTVKNLELLAQQTQHKQP